MTAAVTGSSAAAGWFWRRRVQLRDNRQSFLQGRIEQRDKGFAKLLACADGLQFIKADHYLRSSIGEERGDHRAVAIQINALFHDGVDEVRANIGDTAPLDAVWEYINWVFIQDHPVGQAPGIDEYERIRELVVRCKRVCQEQDQTVLTAGAFLLSENHEYITLLRLAQQSETRVLMSEDGEMLIPMDGDSMTEWLDHHVRSHDWWLYSRDLALDRAYRSGLYTTLPAANSGCQ